MLRQDGKRAVFIVHNLQGTVHDMTNTITYLRRTVVADSAAKLGCPQFAGGGWTVASVRWRTSLPVRLVCRRCRAGIIMIISVRSMRCSYCLSRTRRLCIAALIDGETFSGEPFDSAWRWSVNNRLAESALRLAVLWKLEGEERNRQQVQEILLGYARCVRGVQGVRGLAAGEPWRCAVQYIGRGGVVDSAGVVVTT